ncbi:hypothetical protein [Sphingobacterium faecale]|uniref:DUF3169 family protein n=1 Tax=Sphingobacterium faecale TaxID=2803775 RepID=A0ABS1R893_9SPHI|nr:hypothetical protein [Sphingobacterium faecale]MBL1410051.1 hypothetical protein [Sphingobacterium faecale]
MPENIIKFYRLMTFLLLGICSVVVVLFLLYIYYFQKNSDYSAGLKHGFLLTTLIVIYETYHFIRSQSVYYEYVGIEQSDLVVEKEKMNSALKTLRVKAVVVMAGILIGSILFLGEILPENLYLQGINVALIISASLLFVIIAILNNRYRSFIERLF